MSKTKKSISVILSFLIIVGVCTLVPIIASAETFTSGEYEYSVLADGSVMITKYNGSDSELVVPETIDSKKVTIIGDRAFRENTNIVNVTLPFGVVEIGKSAFWDCKNMHSITIPSSVNRMNYSALGEMMGEEDGTYIRGFVINGYSGSEAEAYSQNGDLDITFNNLSETKTSAEGIYDYVILEDDSAIITQYNGEDEEIVVPDKIDGHKIVRIGNKAFSSNPRDDREKYLRLKKLKKVTLPNSLISIGKSAFYNCSNLVEISVPDSVKYISDSAFSGCDSLSKLDLPKGLIYLGEYALFGTAIETLNLGNMLDEISRALCWDCTALKTVSISDSITSIGDNAFDSCENLKSLDIPKSVSYISPGAFYNCSALESINIAEGNENYSSINGVLFNKEKTELLLYPSGSKESTFNVPDGIERLESSIFYRNFNLKVINLPASVSRIEDNVFTGCFALTDINVDNDNQMYSSKDGVLFNKNRSTLMRYPINKSLSEYVLPDEVSNLPARCFSNSKNLTNVVLPKGLISIGAESFVNCSGLKSITIPSNTKRIEYWALGWYSEGEDEDKYKDFVITGYSGTAAETYAEENGFEFISLGEAPTEPNETETVTTAPANPTEPHETEAVTTDAVDFTEPTTTVFIQPTTVEQTEVTIIEKTDPVTTETVSEEPSESITTEPSTSINTEPAEGLDEYGYYINDYYLAGKIKGEDKGLPNVDKSLRFTKNLEISDSELFLDSVELEAGDSVSIVRYKGNNTFDTYKEGIPVRESGKYQFNLNPVNSSFVYGLKASSGTGASGHGYSNDKKANPAKISVKAKTVKIKKLKKKAQTVKAITVKKAKGKVTYKLVKKGSTAKIFKLAKINSKGVITLSKWKKAKKGTYKLKVTITAAGNSNYNKKTVNKVVKIKIR